jgi:hypothetical protein
MFNRVLRSEKILQTYCKADQVERGISNSIGQNTNDKKRVNFSHCNKRLILFLVVYLKVKLGC